jgi:pseudaminic acid synthase
MNQHIKIRDHDIGRGCPTYIVAEMSANHNQSYDEAVKVMKAAKDAGADAVKLQTYTPDTLTIDCDREYFQIGKGSIWEGRKLYELYREAYTPWEWQPKLQEIAIDLGVDLFSTPFDATAVDFLEKMQVPAYKIASFEIVDLPLIRRIAETAKPVILSTGMATLAEVDEAVATIRTSGNNQIALLKCTSAYPSKPEDMNLLTIPHMADAFGLPTGLSDHTQGTTVPVAAVAMGACIIEKHLTLSRSIPGPDSKFSLEPSEFRAMVEAVRTTEKALGQVSYGPSEDEIRSRALRRSLFVVQDMQAGERFTTRNVRSIRPGNGLHTRYFDLVLGKEAKIKIDRGTPLNWDLIA